MRGFQAGSIPPPLWPRTGRFFAVYSRRIRRPDSRPACASDKEDSSSNICCATAGNQSARISPKCPGILNNQNSAFASLLHPPAGSALLVPAFFRSLSPRRRLDRSVGAPDSGLGSKSVGAWVDHTSSGDFLTRLLSCGTTGRSVITRRLRLRAQIDRKEPGSRHVATVTLDSGRTK